MTLRRQCKRPAPSDQDRQLPLGVPMPMMGFAQDGQASEKMAAERDERFGVSSAVNRKRRSDIDYPRIDPAADAWQKGIVMQLKAERRAGD